MPKLPAGSANPVPATADPTPHDRIKELARLPRGKAWASRLCAFEDAIRAQRKARKSYREIAAWLGTQGLPVSASSVHGFVKARARRKPPLIALPEPAAAPVPATLTPTATPLLAAAPLDGEIHEGYGGPADPDDENPFLMKRKPKRPFHS